MINFISIFSNREIALLVWSLIIIVSIITYRPTRETIPGIVKVFFSKGLITINLSFLAYVLLSIILLQQVNFWETNLIKDTIFWTFGFAFIILFKATKMNKPKDFFEVFKDAIKWTIILEFIVAFYTFSLSVELVLLPVMTFFILLQVFSKSKEEFKMVSKILENILTVIGLSLICYISYKTFFDSGKLITLTNLKSFLLPVMLTILFIPFLYLLSLYSIYESLFVRLNFLIKEEKVRKKIKFQIARIAHLNIDKISNISINIAKEIISDEKLSNEKLKKISTLQ